MSGHWQYLLDEAQRGNRPHITFGFRHPGHIVGAIRFRIENNNIFIVPEMGVCGKTGDATYKLKNAVCEYDSEQNGAYDERMKKQ